MDVAYLGGFIVIVVSFVGAGVVVMRMVVMRRGRSCSRVMITLGALGGGCSHCRRGPHAKAPQSSSRVIGDSSYRRMSSWSFESTMSRRLLRSQICHRSSRRNSRIASLSCSTAGRVPGGMDVVAAKRMCDW
jgi:hypothetical protein